MANRRIHHLVVMDRSTIAGVLSARDLDDASMASDPGIRVQEFMHRTPIWVRPDASLQKAANLLRGHAIGCLPVMDGQKLLGILTITDLLEILGRGAQPRRLKSDRRPRRNEPSPIRAPAPRQMR
jgi:acetoin utilization protein AcuB